MHSESDDELRAEADRLLADGLREILNDYGEVNIVGSYALRLMVWRDLDIHLVQAKLDRKSFFEIGARIADLLSPHRMHYRDQTVISTEGLPAGFYWGVYLGDERAGAWKIDIWLTDSAGFRAVREYGERVSKRLTERTRQSILDIKAACWKHPQYRKAFSSRDIYDAVLDHGIKDVEEFWSLLRDRGRSI
ncbi:MAG TPA: hypothetical protein VKN18_18700 [Blastocatellia bacterium]|nr:hypothetical protein [Blastocatellia bacterium]